MKLILTGILAFGSFFAVSAHACTPSKTEIFLIIKETPAGEEDALIGEIEVADGSVKMERKSYAVTGTDGSRIYVKEVFGNATYTFDRNNVQPGGERYCSPVIFAQ